MARSLRWVRSANLDTSGDYSQAYILATLAPGETLVKTYLSHELLWVDSGTPYTWAGVGVLWGMWVQPGNSLPAILPASNPSSTNPRWLWWDVVQWEEGQPDTKTTPTTWIARNTAESRSVIIKSQYHNATTGNLYLWWADQTPPVPPISGPTLYSSIWYSVGILEAP